VRRSAPIVACVCGGSVVADAGFAKRPVASVAAGALPLGWYAGCIVFTARNVPVAEVVLRRDVAGERERGGPSSDEAGEVAEGVSRDRKLPEASLSSVAMVGRPPPCRRSDIPGRTRRRGTVVQERAAEGAHEKLSASVNCFARFQSFMPLPS